MTTTTHTDLVGMLSDVSAGTPDGIALITPSGAVTYAELDHRSSAAAAWLASRGIGPGDIVAYRASRDVDLIAVAAGILRAGAAFTFLDCVYPSARIAAMMEAVDPSLVVDTTSDASLAAVAGEAYAELPGLPVTGCADALDVVIDPDAAAQIVFTSGSRGRPKAVAIPHRAIVNRLRWMWDEHPFREGDVLAMHKSPALVAAPWEMFGGILAGTTTAMIDVETAVDPHLLWPEIVNRRVTHLFSSPALINALLAEAAEEGPAPSESALRFVTTSAEPLQPDLARRMVASFPNHTRLLNLYGLSECSSNVAAFDLRALSPTATTVPVGEPIANAKIIVADGRLRPVPIGIEGEMLVGGPALALGYLGEDELSASRFVNVDFGDGPQRMMRTGDRARLKRDGNLEFLGRADDQVQVRGFRVELGEIERALLLHPDVTAAALRAYGDAELGVQIRAFVESPGGIGLADLQAHLAAHVPPYMFPNEYHVRESLPRTRSGKVDMVELEESVAESITMHTSDDPPAGPIEEMVASVWCAVLQRDAVSVTANFFDVGGHSLLATKVASRLRHAFEIALPLRAVFDNPTVREMAALIETDMIAALSAEQQP